MSFRHATILTFPVAVLGLYPTLFEFEKDNYEKVLFQTGVYEGKPFMDIRIFRKGYGSRFIPTQKGIRMNFDKRSLKALHEGVKILIDHYKASRKKRKELPKYKNLEHIKTYSQHPNIENFEDDDGDNGDEFIE